MQMKNKCLYLLIATYCVVINISAQEPRAFVNAFESEKTVWSYLYSKDCREEQNIHKTILYGDTTINDIKWKIITGEPMIEKGLVRVDGNKVLFKPFPEYEQFIGINNYNGDPIVIYDFSLKTGDSINIYSYGQKEEIVNVDSVTLNDGNKRKRLTFGNSGHSFIEGMGSIDHSPFFMVWNITTCQDEATLVCCNVNEDLLYINSDYVDCDGTLVGNELIETEKLKIFIDNELLRIVFNEEKSFDVALYNINGILSKQQKKNLNEATLQLSNLIKGIYIVHITSGYKTYSQKIYYK